jgi:hypothetical protein
MKPTNMSFKRVLTTAVIAQVLAFGNTAVPNAAALAVLDRVFDAIQRGRLPPNDIAILEHAAEGRLAESDVAVVVSLGINRNSFLPPAFGVEAVRAHAYRKIGETGLPEALRYLSEVKVADVGTDNSKQVWPAARIALHVALLNNISDRDAKLEFLRNAAVEKNPGFADGQVQNWARNELCDLGDQASLPMIRESLKKIYGGVASDREQEQERYCEVRMQVLARSSDRVQALASVLKLGAQPPDTILMSWAIMQLDAIHSQAADRELARFGEEIARLPKDSPLRLRMYVTELSIHDVLASRSR